VYFMKQTIRNACGTIALIHAVANNREEIKFSDGSLLKAFLEETASLEPGEKGKRLETNADFANTHDSSAHEGQTSAPDFHDAIDFHFVAFVEKEGRLLELDGRKKGPVDHGPASRDSLLEDSAAVCRKFMAKNPECVTFVAVALAKV